MSERDAGLTIIGRCGLRPAMPSPCQRSGEAGRLGKPAAEGAEGSERAVGPYQVEQNQGQEVAALGVTQACRA